MIEYPYYIGLKCIYSEVFELDNKVFSLLKTWCDRFLSLQVHEIPDHAFHGGVLCPACGILHGRASDMAYPLTLMWRLTGEEKYLASADAVVDWCENNMVMPSGLYRNDFASSWFGISAFGYLSLYDAVEAGGAALPEKLRVRWQSILSRLENAIDTAFASEDFRPNINYFAAGAAVMARAWKRTGNERFLARSKEWSDHLLSYVTPDGMLFGEGFHGDDRKSPRGYRAVDLGYNAEESIPLMLLCAMERGDRELEKTAVGLMNTLLLFMLPDGALDNSWGARAAKWTYYGSRTSDGIQGGLVLRPEDPVWREAAWRGFALFEKLTVDGLLAGGAMHREAGQPVCVHHTFTHAKTLAHMLESGMTFRHETFLPSDTFAGVKSFPSCGVYIVGAGDFRASIYASDFSNEPKLTPRGGSMTLLWHKKVGSILAATMNEYFPVEPQNMQLLSDGTPIRNMTPRIEAGAFSNIHDTSFAFTADESARTFTVEGRLKNIAGDPLCDAAGEEAGYRLTYQFTDGAAVITALSTLFDGVYKLPFITAESDAVILDANRLEIVRPAGRVAVESDGRLQAPDGASRRFFNPVGGFDHLMTEVLLPAGKEVTIRISVADNR